MEINSVQSSSAQHFQQQQQTSQAAQQVRPEQQPAEVRQAEASSSASLQAYQQQAREQVASGDTVQLKSTVTMKNLDTVKAIEQMHVRLNELVKGVRETNEQLNKAAEQVAQMQGSLMTIVKNYPPYPIESMERRDLLMSYMSLRKEIESLMVPPPPQPVYEKVRSMWEAMFSQNGQLQPSAVPAVETSSTDKQVQVVSDALTDTMQRLATMSDSVTQGLLQA